MRDTSLVEHDTAGPLDELAATLVLASALISKLKRATDAAALGLDFGDIDQAFSRSIALTRTVRERVVRRGRSEFSSLTNTVRELVGRIDPGLASGVSLVGRYPTGSAIVATDAIHLRRLVQAILEMAIQSVVDTGIVEAEVVDGAQTDRTRRSVRLEVRMPAELDEQDPRIQRLRPLVNALGGTLQLRAPIRGGTALSLRLLAAC